MRELTNQEVNELSGGVGPLALIGIDLALNGVFIACATFMSGQGES